MGTKLLGYLLSGEPVYDRDKPHFNPIPDSVMGLIKQKISTIFSNGRGIIAQEFRFNHVIGKTLCVETSTKDEIYFAKKYASNEWFRFVKNREPEESKLLTIILCKKKGIDEYVLIHRYIGDKGETNPSLDSPYFHSDINCFIRAINYWDCHAFIEGSKKINPNTITTKCPWWYEKKDN